MWQGTLTKMRTRLAEPVEYALADAFQGAALELNALLGRRLRLEHEGQIRCVHCGAPTPKSFGEGACYPCFTRLPQNDLCILKPELCHYHQQDNPCRDPAWGLAHCFIPHLLYLAVSSGLKVGITRETQVPTRWIDQGASWALPVLRLPDRFSVGKAEHFLAAHMPDKTQWQRMLRHEVPEVDLAAERARVLELLEGRFAAEVLPGTAPLGIRYPALEWPAKVVSFNLEKTRRVEGRLLAIKGQYWILDAGVLNIRKHSGWCVTVTELDS
jgi:hypothetical protein